MNILRLTPWNWLTKDTTGLQPAADAAQRQVSPFALHREIDRIFEDAFQHVGQGFDRSEKGAFAPRMDIASSPAEYTVTAELPGMDEKDIQLELNEDALVLKAEKRQESTREDQGYHRVERQYGLFQRVLHLPEDADADAIAASYDKGVLRIAIPRREPQQSPARRIAINTGNA